MYMYAHSLFLHDQAKFERSVADIFKRVAYTVFKKYPAAK
jgi:hypothetical protein